MVLAELRFAFLPERGAVAGGLGVHFVFGQPGNYEVSPDLLTFFNSQPDERQKMTPYVVLDRKAVYELPIDMC